MPKWVRGAKETAYIKDGKNKIEVPICALGGSIATPKKGLLAPVIEVHSIKELESLGTALKGKIVFYNRPMDAEQIETFKAYGHCVDQRSSGAREAAKYGAVGTIVRSMNLRFDDFRGGCTPQKRGVYFECSRLVHSSNTHGAITVSVSVHSVHFQCTQ